MFARPMGQDQKALSTGPRPNGHQAFVWLGERRWFHRLCSEQALLAWKKSTTPSICKNKDYLGLNYVPGPKR